MRKLLAALGLFMLLVAIPVPAHAYDPLDNACSVSGDNSPSSSATCSDRTTEDPVSGNNGVLRKVTTIIALLAGIAAVIVIIIAGIQYMTSGGNAQQAASARNTVIGAAIGLAIIMAAQTIILFVLNRV